MHTTFFRCIVFVGMVLQCNGKSETTKRRLIGSTSRFGSLSGLKLEGALLDATFSVPGMDEEGVMDLLEHIDPAIKYAQNAQSQVTNTENDHNDFDLRTIL